MLLFGIETVCRRVAKPSEIAEVEEVNCRLRVIAMSVDGLQIAAHDRSGREQWEEVARFGSSMGICRLDEEETGDFEKRSNTRRYEEL